MFTIQHIKENGLRFVALQNASKTTTAKICLDQGARLQELKFNEVILIKEQADFDYKESYASSILFPFASRIQDGKYSFLDTAHQLECNENGKNALHGLVYDKKFELFEPEEHKDNCSATFTYYEKNVSKGFPFTYFFSVTYTLLENDLQVRITVKNTAQKPFPFTLGWHPYFYSDSLAESVLSFKSDQKVVFDENLITKNVVACSTPKTFKLKDKQLDDCFILKDNKVSFTTATYKIEISSDSKKNYLQLYTPKDRPIIAIEPMTGVSNTFNNKIGLQVLEPEKTYVLNWNLKFINV
ncbi:MULTISPECIES: aldose 1-epimerase [unclassified Polaribacter]|uniref:aldose 1-epimerase n=1 Tax=unclassified Polaribacter TaxID=196858 RepID=UPI0011BD57D1|nr:MULTISPECIES: aldose 1-epimerase [unclassified Polaribacter]TXD54126.1 aldose 1-epimerase [Polaribacter sp. IC063]TXD62391.1 aldose 1-epimerase [Polaribacter sp. IC066]